MFLDRVEGRPGSAAAEQKRQALTIDLTSTKLTAVEREQKTRELRSLLASMATPEETQALVDAPLESHREAFGLTVPDERVLPKHMLEDYDRDFSGHEQDFLLGARSADLDSKLVGELRDAGIRMAMEAEGRPVSEEAWATMEARFKGRLSPNQFASLKKWWRTSVERTS